MDLEELPWNAVTVLNTSLPGPCLTTGPILISNGTTECEVMMLIVLIYHILSGSYMSLGEEIS